MDTTKRALVFGLLLSVVFVAGGAQAVAPGDYGLKEGDVVSAAGSDDPDVYIVNEWGFKRLFLNPVIFGFYGHLGGFAAVKNVTAATRDAFMTSGLFRNCEANDEKVYGVETTGEDVGQLHWVNTSGAQAVADDPNFFKKVFCINNNEFNWYAKSATDYTSVNQVPNYVRTPGQPPVVVGALSVSLAPGNPVAATTTKTAYGLEFLRVRLSGTGKITSMTFKRLGAGETNDFDNVYVFDGARRLVSGKSLSSSTGEVTFLLNLDVSGTKDLSFVGDYNGTNTNAGNVNYFALTGVTLSSGTVGGLPVTGNAMTVSGASSGTITLDKVGSLANPNAGQSNVQLSEFKLSANTEAALIKRVQLLQGGTVKPSDITNLKLKTTNGEWSGTIDSGGYVVFDLGSGFKIDKGNNAVFKVWADLAGKKTETVAMYVEYATDIYGVGDQYGYGMKATIDTNFDDSTNTHSLTLQGGVLTISFVGPTASDVGTNTTDTEFLRFKMAAAANIEVKKTRIMFAYDSAGNGTWDDIDTTTNGIQDLDDIKIVDVDSGVVVAGPVDGSSFTTDCSLCNPSGTDAGAYVYTDVIDLTGGTTRTFKVTADVKTANTRTADVTISATADDKIALGLKNFAVAAPDIAELKYAGTTTALADADIVPNAHVWGNAMTVKSSGLTLGLASNPGDQTVVKGTSNFDVVGLTFKAGLASALKVTDITLTGYSDADDSGNWDIGSAGDIGSMVNTVKLVERESGTVLATGPTSNNLNATAGTLVYNNLQWNIPAGETRTLLVRADLLNLAAPTKKYFTFDIINTTDVTALDVNSQSINASNQDVNGGDATPVMTNGAQFIDAGHVFVTEYESSPSKSKKSLYWGQTGVAVSQFKVRATNEAFFVDKFNVVASPSSDATDAKNNVKAVYLEYKDKNGATIVSSGASLNTDAVPSVSFGFSGDARPYIPKDDYRVITVKIDTVPSYALGATSGVNFALNFGGTAADEFEATGEGSGNKVLGADVTGDDTDAVTVTNKVYVYRSFPKFAAVPMANGATSGQAVVGKFDITAMGYDVLFGTTANASGTLKFDTLSSGTAGATFTATLYDDASGQVLDTATSVAGNNASITFQSFTSALNVPAGTTKRVRVEASLASYTTPVNTSNGVGADYFQLILQDQGDTEANAVIKWVDASGVDYNNDMFIVAGYLETLPAYGPYLTGQ